MVDAGKVFRRDYALLQGVHRWAIVLTWWFSARWISGLTAAFWLKQKGHSVACLEAGERPGGCITTWAGEGFRFELGPNTVLNNAIEIDRLCEAAGILGERLTAAPASKKRFIVKDGKLLALPGGPVGFLSTPLFSLGAKLRLIKEPFIGRASRKRPSRSSSGGAWGRNSSSTPWGPS